MVQTRPIHQHDYDCLTYFPSDELVSPPLGETFRVRGKRISRLSVNKYRFTIHKGVNPPLGATFKARDGGEQNLLRYRPSVLTLHSADGASLLETFRERQGEGCFRHNEFVDYHNTEGTFFGTGGCWSLVEAHP